MHPVFNQEQTECDSIGNQSAICSLAKKKKKKQVNHQQNCNHQLLRSLCNVFYSSKSCFLDVTSLRGKIRLLEADGGSVGEVYIYHIADPWVGILRSRAQMWGGSGA